jgi:outer membrane protein assembly factor BamB
MPGIRICRRCGRSAGGDSPKVAVGAGADSTPALVGDRLYVLARQGADEVVLSLDAPTGKELWREAYPVPALTGPSARDHSGPRGSPAVANGKVVTIGATGIVSCLNAATGKLLWRAPFCSG